MLMSPIKIQIQDIQRSLLMDRFSLESTKPTRKRTNQILNGMIAEIDSGRCSFSFFAASKILRISEKLFQIKDFKMVIKIKMMMRWRDLSMKHSEDNKKKRKQKI